MLLATRFIAKESNNNKQLFRHDNSNYKAAANALSTLQKANKWRFKQQAFHQLQWQNKTEKEN